jgi:SAM-dependent methyltransferase
MPRVDYDQIAHLYDEPIRDRAVDSALLAFLDGRPDLVPAEARVLDVGCGTGKQLASNRTSLTRTFMLGVDRFSGMLRIAQRRQMQIAWVQGDGTRLPILGASFDYVTNQFSYQHIADRDSFVREVYRILRPGGRFVMTNIDPWRMAGWAIYRYFPEALARDVVDFLPSERFASLMRTVGFANVQVDLRQWTNPEPLADFLAYASDRHRTSQLIVISDTAYEAGLVRLREAAEADDGTATVDSDVCLVTIVGEKLAAL